MPGFLKLIPCGSLVCMHACMCVCVCPRQRLLVTSGVIWISYDWLDMFYNCYRTVIELVKQLL